MTRKDMNNALRSALRKYASASSSPATTATTSLAKPGEPIPGLPKLSSPPAGPAGNHGAFNLMTTGGSAPHAPAASGNHSLLSSPAPMTPFGDKMSPATHDLLSKHTGPQAPPAAPPPQPAPATMTPLTNVPAPTLAQQQQPTTAAAPAQQFTTVTSGGTAPAGAPAQQGINPLMRQQVPDRIHPTKSHTGYGSYVDVLDRWYNPWTTQTSSERGEESLKGWGQTAMGIGGAAAATAAAIPAAAAAGLTAAGGGAMTAGGAAATLGTEVGLPVAFEAGRQQFSGGTETPAPAQNPEQPKPEQQAAATPAAQPTGQPQQPAGEQPKPAAPQTPEQKQQANTNLMQRLNDPNVSDGDKKQAAQQHVQQMLDSNPEMKQGMADLHAGKDTPQAKAFQAEVDKAGNAYVREEFSRLRQQNPGATPQQQGGMLQGIMDSYQKMPTEMKWMMGIGVGGGLLGILGSMFGGGGGMGLMGLLGLGAAGLAGAAGGMFGQGAQDALGGMVGQLGQATGMIPKDMDLSGLKGNDAVQRATQQSSGGGILGGLKAWWDPKGTAEKVKGQLGQANQLNRLMMVPEGMRAGLLKQISPNSSPEEIQQMLSNAKQMHGAMNDPKSQLGQNMQRGQQFVQDPTAYVNNAASEYYNPAKWDVMPWNWGGKSSADHGLVLAQMWAKEADDKATKEWLQKFRARGQKGRWVNTRRGSKTEKRITTSTN